MTPLPETALHRIWERHDLRTPVLRTTDGRTVAVFHAGTPNPDSGPDFLGAVIRIGATTFRGDVEIHVASSGWYLHHHHSDPRYNRVILHVVSSHNAATPVAHTASGRPLPLLILPSSPGLPTGSGSDRDRMIEGCAARLRRYRDLHRSLTRLGWKRIDRKISRFEQRLQQIVAEEHGPGADHRFASESVQQQPAPERRRTPHDLPSPQHWEQLVYEAVMESLGYARNSAAFLLLARSLTLDTLRHFGLPDRERIMGMLFGAAGLLPDPASLADDESASYVRTLHRRWRSRAGTGVVPLIREMDWMFFRLRPANFPTARIAVMAYLLPVLFRPGRLCALLRGMADARTPISGRVRHLRQALMITPEGYWAHHLHFHDRWKDHGVRLGRDRCAIIMLNALVPIAMLHARLHQNRPMARRLRLLARHSPVPYEPRIIREIRQRAQCTNVRLTAMEQGGLFEMVGQMKREE